MSLSVLLTGFSEAGIFSCWNRIGRPNSYKYGLCPPIASSAQTWRFIEKLALTIGIDVRINY